MSATIDVTYQSGPPVTWRYRVEAAWAQLEPPDRGTHPSLHLPRTVLNQGPAAVAVSAHPDPNGAQVIPAGHSASIARPGILWARAVP